MKYFNRQGEEISVAEWRRLYARVDYRNVAQDVVGDVTVVTLWEGIGTEAQGKSHVYQTMVLLPGGDVGTHTRHATEAEALEGHEAAVAEWRAKR